MYTLVECMGLLVVMLVSVLAPSLETQCTNNTHYYVVATQFRRQRCQEAQGTTLLPTTYLPTGSGTSQKMCGRKGSEKKEEEGDK